jgi:hypothetical protein
VNPQSPDLVIQFLIVAWTLAKLAVLLGLIVAFFYGVWLLGKIARTLTWMANRFPPPPRPLLRPRRLRDPMSRHGRMNRRRRMKMELMGLIRTLTAV